jgi:hypothetical protein
MPEMKDLGIQETRKKKDRCIVKRHKIQGERPMAKIGIA